MQGQENYVRAIEQGHYELQETPSLYDPVRIYWENELTKMFLSKHLPKLLAKIGSNRRLRVLDLGCGPGQGFKLLSQIKWHQNSSAEGDIEYVGLDLNQAMLQKAEQIFGNIDGVKFVNQDLRKGLGQVSTENSFDIYYSSYGTLSHLNRDELYNLLQNIVEHTTEYSLVVLDLLGRCSLEWTSFWGRELATYDYTMSWLYPRNKRERLNIEKFPMTFWTGHSLEDITLASPSIKVLDVMDRSILMGRHIDTGEYNLQLKPIRCFVNSLFNPALRTNLEELIVDEKIIPRSDELGINHFFYKLIKEWNILIEFCQDKLNGVQAKGYSNLPNNLSKKLATLENANQLTRDAKWANCFFSGDPRTLMEPQLAYALRDLEYEAQLGIGAGHGLLAVLEIKKLS